MNPNLQTSFKEAEEEPTTPPSVLNDLHNAINLIEEIKSTFESNIRQQLKHLIDERNEYKEKWQNSLQENAGLSASLKQSNRSIEELIHQNEVQSKCEENAIGKLDLSVNRNACSMQTSAEETPKVSYGEHEFIVRSLPSKWAVSYEFLIRSSRTALSSGIIGAAVMLAFTLRLLVRSMWKQMVCDGNRLGWSDIVVVIITGAQPFRFCLLILFCRWIGSNLLCVKICSVVDERILLKLVHLLVSFSYSSIKLMNVVHFPLSSIQPIKITADKTCLLPVNR